MTSHHLHETCIILLCMLTLVGCPGSRFYKGMTPIEEEHFLKSSRDIFPNDVRKSIERYRSEKVSWPGFITEATWVEKEGVFETRFVIEHHYYDWILDDSIQKEKIFLSPRGEGTFSTVCPSKKEQESQTQVAPGNLLIVYGTPERVENGRPSLTCDYARFIKKEWVRTDILDYGRPGEPAKLMNVPGPGVGTTLKPPSSSQ